jgi:hypothetical protein
LQPLLPAQVKKLAHQVTLGCWVQTYLDFLNDQQPALRKAMHNTRQLTRNILTRAHVEARVVRAICVEIV